MGIIRKPLPVKLFSGILTSRPELVADAEQELARRFGPVDLRSEPFPFDSTSYYDEEMGTPIFRSFVGFAELVEPSRIAAIKIETNDLEERVAQRCAEAPRPLNLDPGYIEQGKVVLASTKNYSHRILVSEGIYAEVTLHFQRGAWQIFPWTFPDFKSGRYHEFFYALRRIYNDQLRQLRKGQRER